LHAEKDIDKWLSIVELSCIYIDEVARKYNRYDRGNRGITLRSADALQELNIRFRESSVGYQYESGQIVRMDSEIVHEEIVKPALALLRDPRFEGPQDEYLKAHAHYRAGENKDAITDANNAFESTLKVICDVKGWKYVRGARASDLLKVVRKNGLLPDYLDASFDQLAATLKSGLPKAASRISEKT